MQTEQLNDEMQTLQTSTEHVNDNSVSHIIGVIGDFVTVNKGKSRIIANNDLNHTKNDFADQMQITSLYGIQNDHSDKLLEQQNQTS